MITLVYREELGTVFPFYNVNPETVNNRWDATELELK